MSRRFLFAVGEVLSPLFIIVTGRGADEKCCVPAGGRRGGVAAHLDQVGKLEVRGCGSTRARRSRFCALVVRIGAIVFGEAGFALPILQEEVLDHGFAAAGSAAAAIDGSNSDGRG